MHDRVGHQVRQRPRRDRRATRHWGEQGTLQRSEDIDVADPGAGVGGDRREDAHESFREPDRRVLVEEVGGVAETRDDACRVAVFVELLGQGPLQIEVGGVDLVVDVPDLQVRQFQCGALDVLELEHHLEQRRVRRHPGRAQDLHHPFERNLRVCEGTQIGFPDTTEELGEGVVAVDVGAQDEGVDEHADHVVEFAFAATGDRRPDGNVVRAAHACEHDRQRGMQRHEHRGGVFPRQPHDAGMNVRVDHELDVTAAKGPDGGPGTVGGQLQQFGQVRQRGGPVGELPRDGRLLIGFRSQPLPLPQRVVGVLHVQGRPVRGGPNRPGRIRGHDVPGQRCHREAVGGDVMHHHREHVHVLVEPEQSRAQRQFRGHVESCGQQCQRLFAEFGFTGHTDRSEIGHCTRRGQDHLAGAVVGEGEEGAHGLVPFDDVRDRRLKRVHVEPAVEPQCEGDVVGGGGRVELVDEPHPLLGRRHGDFRGAFPRFQRGAGLEPVLRLGQQCQTRDGGGVEHVA
ncbi:hypothetical protein Rhow_001085 [Rhodococcus wratislaviensis]|uniref:Uncharacterized protein n=1 Tax=Rhodococcus wratislaviensis TaxID=44752 RepID=A0A402CN61_RHOWR|nr:hypothetical protein Rhow_001085 [Rhodococcus wratislaviensis]